MTKDTFLNIVLKIKNTKCEPCLEDNRNIKSFVSDQCFFFLIKIYFFEPVLHLY